MAINVSELLQTVTTVATLVQQVTQLVESVDGVLSSKDEAEINRALEQIQKNNDILFQRVSKKLQDAAKN